MRPNKRMGVCRFLTGALAVVTASILLTAASSAAADQSAQKKTDAAAQQIQIAADRFMANTSENYAEFTGNVEAVQGDFEILSDNLRVYYKTDNSGNRDPLAVTDAEIREIVASGNVRIATDNRKAETEKAVYNMESQEFVLSGKNSTLSSDQNFIRGSTITFNRLTRQVKIRGRDQQRVTGAFYSEERPRQAPPETTPGVVFLTPPPKRAGKLPAPEITFDPPPEPAADSKEIASPEVGTSPDSLPVVEELVAYNPEQPGGSEEQDALKETSLPSAENTAPETQELPTETVAANDALPKAGIDDPPEEPAAPEESHAIVTPHETVAAPAAVNKEQQETRVEAVAADGTAPPADIGDPPEEPAAPAPASSETVSPANAPEESPAIVSTDEAVAAPDVPDPKRQEPPVETVAANDPTLPAGIDALAEGPAAPQPASSGSVSPANAPEESPAIVSTDEAVAAPDVPDPEHQEPPVETAAANDPTLPAGIDALPEEPAAPQPASPETVPMAEKAADPQIEPAAPEEIVLARAHTEPLAPSAPVVSEQLSPVPVVPLKNLTKRVAMALFENTTAFPEKGFGMLLLNKLAGAIREENSNVELLLPGDPEYPGILLDLPRQASGYINNLLLVQAGRELGLNAIVTGTLVDIKIMTEPTGFWIFKGSQVVARVVVQVAVFDTETGTKLYDELLVQKVEMDEADLYAAQQGQVPEIPGIEEVLTDMAQNMGEAIAEKLENLNWRGFIVSKEGGRVVLSSGSLSGLMVGNKLVVYDETPITGLAGHQYYLPGQKAGIIQVITLLPNRAEAVVTSGSYIRAGLPVADPDDDTAGEEGWAKRLKFW